MLRPPRKHRYSEFPRQASRKAVFLLTAFFLLGMAISARRKIVGLAVYLLAWVLSYPVIYAGTCRKCPYYGKRCPIPLEGSCVGNFLARGAGSFGYAELFWAGVAYLLRMAVPAGIILLDRLRMLGSAYLGIVAAYWTNHLLVEGCPNCINSTCPLNPDH
ncbi:MAG: hypothetical protein ABFD81_03945 [Syntrophaceae bacterium]